MRSLIGVVLRRSWLILAVAVLVGIGLFTIAKRRPLTYTATAQLEVLNMNSMRQAIGIPGSVPSEVLLVEIPPQIHRSRRRDGQPSSSGRGRISPRSSCSRNRAPPSTSTRG